ncbi:hypothetical protein HYH03_012716 [Edaphochlamys debaryana]|uniref:Uncharacterized protein n=1 Tax=Edaphochlamys debaryana TaxID=47281 RepID=A0A835XRF4_9CHLO|nr:hypothetical protein HYH03_012716 [Edaphochlamys debaryana]|eukprot:KAG2488716.1 hypothetical protein HYH03_012716 [Edaphochlamys debaryana]
MPPPSRLESTKLRTAPTSGLSPAQAAGLDWAAVASRDSPDEPTWRPIDDTSDALLRHQDATQEELGQAAAQLQEAAFGFDPAQRAAVSGARRGDGAAAESGLGAFSDDDGESEADDGSESGVGEDGSESEGSAASEGQGAEGAVSGPLTEEQEEGERRRLAAHLISRAATTHGILAWATASRPPKNGPGGGAEGAEGAATSAVATNATSSPTSQPAFAPADDLRLAAAASLRWGRVVEPPKHKSNSTHLTLCVGPQRHRPEPPLPSSPSLGDGSGPEGSASASGAGGAAAGGGANAGLQWAGGPGGAEVLTEESTAGEGRIVQQVIGRNSRRGRVGLAGAVLARGMPWGGVWPDWFMRDHNIRRARPDSEEAAEGEAEEAAGGQRKGTIGGRRQKAGGERQADLSSG